MTCSTCNLNPARYKGECPKCFEYRRRTGRQRPSSKLDTPSRQYLAWCRRLQRERMEARA